MTSGPIDPHAECRERLSALMDGELSGAVLHQACGHWREATESRSAWHVYHVIGDVLRSDELAGGADRNARFLESLRGRLATEPIVFAPAPLESVRRETMRPRTWRTSAAVAGGVVAVAGVLLFVRSPGRSDTEATAMAPAAPGTRVAAAPVEHRTPQSLLAVSATGSAAPADTPRVLAPNDPLIRDARLDRYLEAHKQFAGSSALGVPVGFLRAATAEAVGR